MMLVLVAMLLHAVCGRFSTAGVVVCFHADGPAVSAGGHHGHDHSAFGEPSAETHSHHAGAGNLATLHAPGAPAHLHICGGDPGVSHPRSSMQIPRPAPDVPAATFLAIADSQTPPRVIEGLGGSHMRWDVGPPLSLRTTRLRI